MTRTRGLLLLITILASLCWAATSAAAQSTQPGAAPAPSPAPTLAPTLAPTAAPTPVPTPEPTAVFVSTSPQPLLIGGVETDKTPVGVAPGTTVGIEDSPYY